MRKRQKKAGFFLTVCLLGCIVSQNNILKASEEKRELPNIIDPDDSIQDILERQETGNQLLPPLDSEQEESDKKEYPIQYQLNNGKNHPSNPTSYRKGDHWKLKNPSKKGYLFLGWYSDRNLTKKVNQITEEDTGIKYFYAKWKKVSVPRVQILRATSKKEGRLIVKLQNVKGAKGYQVEIFRDAALRKPVGKARLKKQTGYFTKLPKGKAVFVRARCYMADSTGKIIYGDYSKAVKVKIKKGTAGKS